MSDNTIEENKKRYQATENGRQVLARAQKKYRGKIKSITIYFAEDEIELYEEIERAKGEKSFSEFGLEALKSVL
jgi:DNA-binding PadR family transcriptional regulator